MHVLFNNSILQFNTLILSVHILPTTAIIFQPSAITRLLFTIPHFSQNCKLVGSQNENHIVNIHVLRF